MFQPCVVSPTKFSFCVLVTLNLCCESDQVFFLLEFFPVLVTLNLCCESKFSFLFKFFPVLVTLFQTCVVSPTKFSFCSNSFLCW